MCKAVAECKTPRFNPRKVVVEARRTHFEEREQCGRKHPLCRLKSCLPYSKISKVTLLWCVKRSLLVILQIYGEVTRKVLDAVVMAKPDYAVLG